MFLKPLAFVLVLGICGEAPVEQLDRLVAQGKLARRVDPATGCETLSAPGFEAVMAPGLSVAFINGEPVRLSAPVAVAGGRIVIPRDLAATILSRSARVAPPAAKVAMGSRRVARPFKIVIDAGHGGMHTGGKSHTGRIFEKDVNLDVSLRLRTVLEGMGVEVVMTRTTDVHFADDVDDDLHHRVAVSNRARPDFFLSIHANYDPRPDPRGFEVYVYRHLTEAREGSRVMASEIRRLFKSSLETEDRGIKESGFKVIRHTDAPAALVELEFLSNPRGERELGSADHRQKLADLLAEAVWRYANK